ncbi:MFS transporter [Parashewanella tropica]|uniref:MFS transporter n=1 Tax=Parashewanella tropica TaxID=2547970 RepID=UPI00105933A8|nr:MFS transporter [Parashewanella tropica]
MERSLHYTNEKSGYYLPISIIGGLFFIFGFVTWLNGALIPFLQIACELNHIEAYLITMTFYFAYTVMAIPVSSILNRVGYKQGMSIGLAVMAVGALFFIPAAYFRYFPLFLSALFVLGTGLTLLQTAANPYIVLIGPKESAAVRISMMGLLNKGAGFIAPILFTALIFADVALFANIDIASLTKTEKELTLSELSSRLILPYFIMAIVLGLLAVLIGKAALPSIANTEQTSRSFNLSFLKHYPQLYFGVATLFFYVGVEVIAGDTIGVFGKELGTKNFTQLTSYTMAFMVLAYILGMILIPKFISQARALKISAVLGIMLTLLILLLPNDTQVMWNFVFGTSHNEVLPDVVLLVAMLGLSNALVWPAVWPMALDGVEQKYIGSASALLIMAISGGAILPFVYGVIAEYIGDLQLSYAIMLPCYLFILFYSIMGQRRERLPA